MLNKTRGIVLKTTNYSESSLVAQIYTESFGMQSYLIAGARKPKAKIKANILQPLHLLEIIATHKDNGSLQRISEARQTPVLQEIPYDIIKSSLALFLNEILYKILKEQESDPYLFEFIHQSVRWLDETHLNLANFHLLFLIKLTRFLGFYPTVSKRALPYFNLHEATFSNLLPEHPFVLQEPHTSIFRSLTEAEYSNCDRIRMSSTDRQFLLEKLLDFYRLHRTNFREIKSLYILEEIFR
ncbi:MULTISPECIES: DNA repair protein RecO [unclassified Sphingobacterium]|uniref:DNA repair protein RecO n=1 Tax=unclassified Sphingobacterium TaxID=2609468 RepID=UPI0025E0F73D|nr:MULTISPECIES: DNA repair protein RecO [unclassified Sphingobacterium]